MKKTIICVVLTILLVFPYNAIADKYKSMVNDEDINNEVINSEVNSGAINSKKEVNKVANKKTNKKVNETNAIDQGALDAYNDMLESRHDPNNNISESTKDAMWASFYDHIDRESNVEIKVPEVIMEKEVKEKVYTVDTLVGGNGLGYKDGNVRSAKINPVYSLACDNYGNVYFVDEDNNAVRKYIANDKTVRTYKSCDADFDVTESNDEGGTTVLTKDMCYFNKVVYNRNDKNIYLSVSYEENFSIIFKLEPKAYPVTFNDEVFPWSYITTNDFIRFDNKNNIWFSDRFSCLGDPSRILKAKYGKKAEELTRCNNRTFKDKTNTGPMFRGKTDAIVGGNTIYVCQEFFKKLYKITLFPNKIESVAEIDFYFDAITVKGDTFYLAKGNKIYTLDKTGKLKLLLDDSNIKYNSGGKIRIIETMEFGPDGNLYIYDATKLSKDYITNGSIRRINF